MDDWAVSVYQGPAGDHQDRAVAAVPALGRALGRALTERVGQQVTTVGEPVPARPGRWDAELARSLAGLRTMAERVAAVLADGQRPLGAITRCAVALATQPVVLRHRPDAVLVWFDAHGDLNTPADSASGYLGGMALSGPLGWWDSGLGAGPPASRAVLVGARDLDPAESAHVAAGRVDLVLPGPHLAERLADAVGGRPVSVHVDCDVLEPGLVATDYAVPAGLSLEDLHACAESLAGSEVVALEVGEYEGDAAATATDLVDALAPLVAS